MPDPGRIRIGNQTALSAATPMEPFEYALGRGFDAFEWFPDRRADGHGWTESDLSADDRDAIRRAALDRDVALSVHGSWDANALTPAGAHRLDAQAAFAAAIGARLLVAHLFLDDDAARFVDAIAPLVARLARDGMVLALENTVETSARDVNDLFVHLGRREFRGAVGLCLDVGHANLHSATRNDYLAYVDQLASGVPIAHVHLHENRGECDDHLPLFTGPAAADPSGVEALVARLVRRGFAGCMILEQWPQPPTLLDAARGRLLRMIHTSRETP